MLPIAALLSPLRIRLLALAAACVPAFDATAQCPDLIVSELSVTAFSPTSVAYRFTILNIGNAPANLDGPTPALTDNVVFQALTSADTIYGNGNDGGAGGAVVSGVLAPAGSLTLSFMATVAIDRSVRPFIVLRIDAADSLVECDENNNDAATPAAYVLFGSGCAGSNGTPAIAACIASLPQVGGTICVNVTRLSTNAADPAWMFVGLAPMTPVSLNVIQMTGCTLLVNPLVTQPLVKIGSNALWLLNVTNDPSVLGLHFFNQVFAVDTNPAPNPFGATVSNGADGAILL